MDLRAIFVLVSFLLFSSAPQADDYITWTLQNAEIDQPTIGGFNSVPLTGYFVVDITTNILTKYDK